MAEELKALIEKIQEEGVRAAQEKADAIIEEARKKADALMFAAKEESSQLLAQANTDVRRLTEVSEKSLQQAARNTLLSLKEEIERMLEKVIAVSIAEALSAEELAKMIADLIKHSADKDAGQIVVSLNKADQEKLEKALLAKLKAELRKSVTLKAQGDIRAGFTISFDSGKSCFDFTDRALAEYLGAFLKPKLAKIFQEIIKNG
jgi:V/A-type H+-transporting ATPase subunit E